MAALLAEDDEPQREEVAPTVPIVRKAYVQTERRSHGIAMVKFTISTHKPALHDAVCTTSDIVTLRNLNGNA